MALLLTGPGAGVGWGQMAHPNLYLNQEEIDLVIANADAGREPWKGEYARLIRAADMFLKKPPVSITDNGGGNRWDHKDIRETAPTAADQIQTLALAYALSGNAAYADKAVACIETWCVNRETRFDSTLAWAPVHFIQIPQYHVAITFGIDLVWNYPGFTSDSKDAVRQWARALGNGFRFNQDKWRHNRQNWELLVVMFSAYIAGDGEMLNWAINYLEEDRLVRFIDPDGGGDRDPVYENRSLHYMMFGAVPMMKMIDISRHLGYDFYHRVPYNHDKSYAWAHKIIAGYMLEPNSYPGKRDWPGAAYVEPHSTLGLLYTKADVFENVLRQYDFPQNSWSLKYARLTHSPGAYNPWSDKKVESGFALIKPATREFVDTQEVVIDNPIPGAVVRYSLDGSDPTSACALYEGPFTISSSQTIRARLFKDGNSSATSVSILTQKVAHDALSISGDKPGWSYKVYEHLPSPEPKAFVKFAGDNAATNAGVSTEFKGRQLRHYIASDHRPSDEVTFGVEFSGYLDLNRDDV